MIPAINPQGNHVGGLVGFLKSIGYAIKLIRPTRIILVFDGQGNITNRRNTYADYKANRQIKRITNFQVFSSLEEESESVSTQMMRLLDYLKCLPVDIAIVTAKRFRKSRGSLFMTLSCLITLLRRL